MSEIISIGFGGGYKPAQAVIELATWSKDAHCWGQTDKPGTVIDSTFKHGGVRLREMDPAKDYRWHDAIDLRGWTTKDERQGLYDYGMTQVGKPYDLPWIIGFPLNRDWQDEEAWVCSEFEAKSFLEVGIFRSIHQHRITPSRLRGALEFIRKVRS